MKNNNQLSNHTHTLAFFAALREIFSSKSLRLCVGIFGIFTHAKRSRRRDCVSAYIPFIYCTFDLGGF